jgi:hypothetical protein
MVKYRRNFQAGATYFFTVTLAGSTFELLVDHVAQPARLSAPPTASAPLRSMPL